MTSSNLLLPLTIILAIVASSINGLENEEDGVFHDWRATQQLGNMVSAVRNYRGYQGSTCSAGFIFAATAMVADRLAILQPQVPKVQLSNQHILNCIPDIQDGCEKGSGKIEMALKFIKANGGVTDRTCYGWKGKKLECSAETTCVNCLPTKCETRHVYIKYPISNYYPVKTSFVSLSKELVNKGPIACETKSHEYGTLVAVEGKTFVMKHELGVFYKQDGFGTIQSDELLDCWAATVEKPFRHFDKNATAASSNARKLREIEGRGRKRFEGHREAPSASFKNSFGQSSKNHHYSLALTNENALHFENLAVQGGNDEEKLPANFSWMEKDGKSLLVPMQSHHNMPPHYCGACWSLASSATFSDRLKIKKGFNASDVFVSPQTTVDCVRTDSSVGCGGGIGDDVFQHLIEVGNVDETCNPWISDEQKCLDQGAGCKTCDENGVCHQVPKEKYSVYKASSWGHVSGEKNMMKEIYANGPIDCGIATPPALDEFFFGDEIICDKDTPPKKWEITHDISIVGWGVDGKTGQKYWVIRNSWSTAWGNNGFARVCRGEDGPGGNMLLESNCSWIIPKLD